MRPEVVFRNKPWKKLLGQDQIFILIVIAILLAAILVKNQFILNIVFLVFLTAALANCYNLIGGIAGQPVIGHIAYFGIGAYTSTILYNNFGVSPWLGMLAAGALGGVAGALTGYPCFRLRGLFLSMTTLSVAVVTEILANYLLPLTKGPTGLFIRFQPSLVNMMFINKLDYVFIAAGFFLFTIFVIWLIERAKLGLQAVAIRENEDAAEMLGINTELVKNEIYIVSAALVAMGGTIYAQYYLFVSPQSTVSWLLLLEWLLVTVLGGNGYRWGPFVGTAVLIPVTETIRFSFVGIRSGLDLMVVGCFMIFIILVLPGGILGTVGLRHKLRTLFKLRGE